MTAARGTTAKYFDVIVALVAGGMQIKAAVTSRPDFPKYPAFKKFVANHPDYRAQLDAVRPQLVGSELLKANFDQFLAAIKSGASINAACASVNVSCTSLYWLVENDTSLKFRFAQAISEREAGSNATGAKLRAVPRRRWSEADFEEAVAAIRDTRETSVEAVLRPPLMPKQMVYKWAVGHALRTELLRAALDSRPIAKHRRTVAKGPTPIYRKEVLRTGLFQNDLFRQANAAVRMTIDPILRDDMISEIVEAVLSGSITHDEIKSRGAAIGTAFMRRNSYYNFESLDRLAGHGEDYDRTLGDTLTTDSVAAWGI
jgi:hypothetical protein